MLYFSVLLLCTAAMLATNVEASHAKIRGERCTHGVTMIWQFSFFPCGFDNKHPVRKLLDAFPDLVYGAVTVNRLQQFVNRYCSTAMPAMRRCFAESISDCDLNQQDYLNSLATGTGIICKPNSNEVSPWVHYVISRLTDEDWSSTSCRRNTPLIRTCYGKAEAAMRLPAGNSAAFLETASIQEMVSVMRKFYSTAIECVTRSLRDSPNRCSNWRHQVFEEVVDMLHAPPLGFTVNYSQDQVAQMLGYSSRRRNIPAFPYGQLPQK